MTERQGYDVLTRFPGFELRRYPAHLVAEVEVDSAFDDAGNRAFGLFFDPPWTPWFLRHNDVVQPVAADPVPVSPPV
jgi:hypothetical protein